MLVPFVGIQGRNQGGNSLDSQAWKRTFRFKASAQPAGYFYFRGFCTGGFSLHSSPRRVLFVNGGNDSFSTGQNLVTMSNDVNVTLKILIQATGSVKAMRHFLTLSHGVFLCFIICVLRGMTFRG